MKLLKILVLLMGIQNTMAASDIPDLHLMNTPGKIEAAIQESEEFALIASLTVDDLSRIEVRDEMAVFSMDVVLAALDTIEFELSRKETSEEINNKVTLLKRRYIQLAKQSTITIDEQIEMSEQLEEIFKLIDSE